MEDHLLPVWESVQPGLRRFVYSRVRDLSLTEDLLHDAFLKVRLKMDTVEDPNKMKSWIYQVTRNLIADHYRKKSIVPEAEANDPGSNFNDCVSNQMRKLIHALPDKYREAVQLSELGGMSQVQLAESLGISFSGAKSRVQRARVLLRRKLEEQMLLEADRYGNIIDCVCKQAC